MKTIKLLKRILHKHSSIVLSSSSSLQTKTTNSLPKLITNKNNKLNNNNNNNNNNSFDNNDFDYNNNNNNFDNNNKSNDNFDKFDNNNVLLKLFITGSTIGPLVDSIHNQCLLTYNKLPIQIEWPIIFYDNVIVPFNNYNSENNNNVNYLFNNYLFTSSWYVPLLLGFAYIVLGYLLPYIIQNGVNNIVMFISNNNNNQTSNNDNNTNNIQIFMNKFLGIQTIKPKETTTAIITKNDKNNKNYNIINETNDDDDNNYDFKNLSIIRTKAILAVLSTAFIIKFSEFLVLNPNYFLMNDTINNNNNNPINVILQSFINSSNNDQTVEQFNLLLLFIVTIIQWLLLDCTLTSLITASIVSIFGPLSEIPFISLNIWSYLPNVIDKLPLLTYNNDSIINPILIQLFGINYQELGISSISAPCYFAVTMDAIALKRWFSFSTK